MNTFAPGTPVRITTMFSFLDYRSHQFRLLKHLRGFIFPEYVFLETYYRSSRCTQFKENGSRDLNRSSRMVRMADTLSLSNVKRIQKVLVIGIGILAQPERSGRNFKLYNYKNRNQDNKKETDYWPWIIRLIWYPLQESGNLNFPRSVSIQFLRNKEILIVMRKSGQLVVFPGLMMMIHCRY